MAIQHLRKFKLRVRIDKTRIDNAKRLAKGRRKVRKFLTTVVFEE